jgi:hypothetical protein
VCRSVPIGVGSPNAPENKGDSHVRDVRGRGYGGPEVNGEVMTVHVLHADDGYTYLTRQVASGASTW